jgi:PleD family two-component response regulator
LNTSELILCSMPIQDPIPVLLVSGHKKDQELLTRLFNTSDFVIFQAFTCAEAAGIIQQYPIPVVVTDQALSDGNWTQVQSAHALSAIPPIVIVLGDRKDPAFWADAFARGAFDVLFRPLTEAIVVRAVRLGYLRWNRRAERMSARDENMQATTPRDLTRRPSRLAFDTTAESRTPVPQK